MKTQKKLTSLTDLLTDLRKEPDFQAAEKELEPKAILARNILRLRAELRMTQKELALQAGMSQPRIAEIEKMKGNPSLETLHKIALILNVTAAELLSQRIAPIAGKKKKASSVSAPKRLAARQHTASVR